MQFWHYFAIRLIQAFVVVFLVVTIVFFVSRTVGNPEVALLPFDASNADLERVKESLGLNDPLIVQYGNFLLDLVQGDFGTSWRGGGQSTISVIGDKAVNTVKLGVAGLVFAIATAVPLGVAAGLKRGRSLDWLARSLAVVGQAVPGFWLGLMMIFFFAVRLGWCRPAAPTGVPALIMPAVALGMLEMAAIMRLTRSGMIEVLDTTSCARRGPRGSASGW